MRPNISGKKTLNGRRSINVPSAIMAKQLKSLLKNLFLTACISSFFINILTLAGPIYMLQIYDRVLTSRSLETLAALTVLLVVIYISMGILETARDALFQRISLRIGRFLATPVFAEAVKSAGKLMSSSANEVTQDLQKIKRFISGPSPTAFLDAPWAIILITFIWFIHWTLGVVALVGAIVLFALAVANRFFSRSAFEASAVMASKANSWARTTYRNTDTAIPLGMLADIGRRWKEMQDQAALESVRAGDINGRFSGAIKTLRMMLQSLILGAGALLVIQDIITPGMMIAVSLMLGRALAPVQQLVTQWRSITETAASYARLRKVINQHELNHEKPLQMLTPKGALRVQKVFAAPPGMEKPFLKNINFIIEPGQMVGIIGSSGSGKSLLARIVVGAWSPIRGHVRLDGASLDNWDNSEFGRNIGFMPQDIELFPGTVKENIGRFRLDISSESVVGAAITAGIHDLILSFPKGYDTLVGESGMRISGGERQRIAFARALYGDPPFIVLDEPNSNLDSEGEKALNRALTQLKTQKKSIIVISHRCEAFTEIDNFLILDQGRIKYFGPQNEIPERQDIQRRRLAGKRQSLTF